VTADAEDGDGVVPAPSTEKKKKRKKRHPGEAQVAAPVDGPKRSDFAADWPAHPELDALLAAFDRGNYAFVRERGRALVAGDKHAAPLDAPVQAAVQDLLRRIEPDRTAVIMLGVAVLLMAFLAWFYWTHPHGE
jgi:hypothetical protein